MSDCFRTHQFYARGSPKLIVDMRDATRTRDQIHTNNYARTRKINGGYWCCSPHLHKTADPQIRTGKFSPGDIIVVFSILQQGIIHNDLASRKHVSFIQTQNTSNISARRQPQMMKIKTVDTLTKIWLEISKTIFKNVYYELITDNAGGKNAGTVSE
ncbi:hypothetical protein DFH09DRAFT_1076797 [Mycena vulgaris]|nr:hypothetical protein DFH09DRAFT_1076797 [Mycena vulgaris]